MTEAEGQKGIEVIVAGLGRTGTMSLMEAFRILGYTPYHMESFLSDPSHPAMWRAVAEGRATPEEALAKVAADGFTATMDNPMCDVYESQLKLNPGAKVILSRHPGGAAGWERSFKTLMRLVQIQSTPFSLTYPNFMSFLPMSRDINALRNMMGTVTMGLPPGELTYRCFEKPDGWLASQYETHNAHVRAHVPSSQLLEYCVDEGWEPLCAFLGKPVPDVPFPKVNDSATIRRVGYGMQAAIYAWIPLLLLAASRVRLIRAAPRRAATFLRSVFA